MGLIDGFKRASVSLANATRKFSKPTAQDVVEDRGQIQAYAAGRRAVQTGRQVGRVMKGRTAAQYQRAFTPPRAQGGQAIASALQQQFKQAVNQPRRRVVRTRTLRTPQYNQMMAQRMAQVRAARQMPQQQYNNPNLSQQSPYQPQMAQGSPQRAPAYIFRGTGVNPLGQQPTSLPPSRETIAAGYLVKVDLMSGKRYLVPIKPPERWIAKY